MTSTKRTSVEKQLKSALDSFAWKEAKQIVDGLIERVQSNSRALDAETGRRLLSALRRKCRLDEMARLAEALIEARQGSLQIRRQYAQALIDLGYLSPAEQMLDSLAHDAKGTEEEAEARGLIGRIYKQMYVNNRGDQDAANRKRLERALNEYLFTYRMAPTKNLWHGINVVALTALAKRDHTPLTGMAQSKALAKDILAVLSKEGGKQKDRRKLSAWDLATAMEAQIALGNTDQVLRLARDYTSSNDADAFEINSTLRQMTEVWGLTEKRSPGSRLLPLLRAALLSKQGGSVRLEAEEAKADCKSEVRSDLEKVFGDDRFIPLATYQLGLKRAESVARIEKLNGQGHGTGWLVREGDFFSKSKGRLLLLTNHHVISDPPYDRALPPNRVQIHFQMLGLKLKPKEIVWTSPTRQFDATFVTLEKKPGRAEPLEIAEDPVQMTQPPPRLFIIGHPGGRDLEFSLEDSRLVGLNKRLLHYRTPTEGGSSGSPVFEDQEWKVVALHHAGKGDMQRLGGKGTYEANEGIAIDAIRRATRGRT